ncbi:cupin-like domain-containing protein [Aureliella helgolandensis]|uniref:JmjC domain-containing protein n=1 Tax=Aureliella helgolandensis TaxID=2527968 RepID=A0A518GAL7_9BACT|nr:cupin-like domain-containing protein [Aureliella helgolandensis]QDV25634.1 hypothetical protein Q31a_39600 [Aureliella helgolandensis]
MTQVATTVAKTVQPDAYLKSLDAREFTAKFNRQPFTIGHQLVDHPLFDLQRLVELSQFLPPNSVEYNSGDLPVTQDPDLTPRNGLAIDETIRRIEECQSWMVLKNVEQDPEFRDILYDCLDEIREIVEPIAPGMRVREGFIFVSSAGSVTPFHIDPENNFLLQIRGHKQVQLFDVEDRSVMSEEQLEKFFTGAHRNIPFLPEYEAKGHWFELQPGEGLHFPVAAPHWVKNGSQVSISFSITFQTDSSQRRQSLHRWNNGMRRMGIPPSPVGARPWSDEVKYAGIRGCRVAKRILGKK